MNRGKKHEHQFPILMLGQRSLLSLCGNDMMHEEQNRDHEESQETLTGTVVRRVRKWLKPDVDFELWDPLTSKALSERSSARKRAAQRSSL